MSERVIDTNAKAALMGAAAIAEKNKFKLPELLAPVGGPEHLVAAVNNGADAVYLGGSIFNARMKAENFIDLKWAIDYAHGWGVKVYITLNTLIKDKELPKAFEYAFSLYEMGADAVILQDMGLARLIHKYLPDFPTHLSTQGTVYNKSGVELAGEMGFTRVVAARECSLGELREMCETGHKKEPSTSCHELRCDDTDGPMARCDGTDGPMARCDGTDGPMARCDGTDGPMARCDGTAKPVEIEVFVHGALCMCYSGQCQMSRILGGGSARSGNRGLCAQPCRLQYRDDNGKLSYPLSPRDICSLDILPELCGVGIGSFKIEGRLKSPEYVAVVTRVYRKYLDIYAKADKQSRTDFAKNPELWRRIIEKKDRQKLLRVFNRGGFTEGYLHGNPESEILSGRSPKNQGIAIGKVIAVRNAGGKASADRKLLDVKLSYGEEIVMGDGIELGSTGNLVTYLEEKGQGIVRVGDFKTPGGVTIDPGETVRRVRDKKLAEEALKPEPVRKSRMDMTFTGKVGMPAELRVISDGKVFGITDEKTIERALKRPADPDRIREQLSRLGNTAFEAGKIEIRADKDAMIPVSLINSLRRQAVDMVIAERVRNNRKPNEEVVTKALREIEMGGFAGETGNDMSEGDIHQDLVKEISLVPLEVFMENYIKGIADQKDVIPYILNVSKGKLDDYIRIHFDEIVEAASDRGIAVGNLGWIIEFREAGLKIYGDYGLNVYNRQAELAFEELGLEVIQWSDEISTDGHHVAAGRNHVATGRHHVPIKAVHRIPKEMESVPLMITEHPLEFQYLVDRKGVKHEVMKWHSGDKFLIF